jgi:hypothetical protein
LCITTASQPQPKQKKKSLRVCPLIQYLIHSFLNPFVSVMISGGIISWKGWVWLTNFQQKWCDENNLVGPAIDNL